jgi:hypothetical protein
VNLKRKSQVLILLTLSLLWPVSSAIGQNQLPNLVIQDITWLPKIPIVGDTVEFTVYFGNQGSGPMTVWSYICDYVDEILVNRIGVRPVDAGNMGNVNMFTWQASSAGPHTVKAIADCTNIVVQSNKNNVMTKFFKVFNGGTSESYVVHVDFNFFLSLDTVSVSLLNQNGRLLAVATVSSPSADHADIHFSTSVPITLLTARAAGQAKFSFIIFPVSGSNTIAASYGYEYWMQVDLY